MGKGTSPCLQHPGYVGHRPGARPSITAGARSRVSAASEPRPGSGQVTGGGGTSARGRRRLLLLGFQARGPREPSAGIPPRPVVRSAAARLAWSRKFRSPPGTARHAPLTEEALHDPERVAQPVFSTGHGAEGRGQRGPCGAPLRAERARSPATPRGLGRSSSAPSHARRGASRATGLRASQGEATAVTGTSASELLASDPRRGDGPSLRFSQWREIAATDRAASDLGGARGGGAAGACCALPEGREWAGRAAILETGTGRAIPGPPSWRWAEEGFCAWYSGPCARAWWQTPAGCFIGSKFESLHMDQKTHVQPTKRIISEQNLGLKLYLVSDYLISLCLLFLVVELF